MKKSSFFQDYRRNLLAGVIVFLIALPLCLGIAQASGAPLFSGIIAGIVGGLVVGGFSGSRLSVTGPAAGLTAIVLVAISDLGSFSVFLCAVIIAGFIQIVLGFLRAGAIAHFIPHSVIEGMMAGIGLTIILKLIPDALGYVPGPDSESMFQAIAAAIGNLSPAAVVISLVGLGLMVAWSRTPLARLRYLPAGLMVVLLAVAINLLWPSLWGGPLAGEQLVNLYVPEQPQQFFEQFLFPDFSGLARWEVWQTGMVIAAVASIESLLCLEASDKLDPERQVSPPNRELKAQGLGNLVSGLLGGLPVTSVIVRTSANVHAGGTSRLSTMFHGLLLLLCVALIPAVLNWIPKAALAAILIYTGYRLCNPAKIRSIWQHGKWNPFLPFAITALGVVSIDLLSGVALGLGISIIYTLWENMRIPYFFQRIQTGDRDLLRITLAQEVSFLNKASIKQTLNQIPRGTRVVIDASQTGYIDYDVRQTILEFYETTAKEREIELSLVGFKNVYQVPKAEPEASILEAFSQPASAAELSSTQRSSGKYRRLIKQLSNQMPA